MLLWITGTKDLQPGSKCGEKSPIRVEAVIPIDTLMLVILQ